MIFAVLAHGVLSGVDDINITYPDVYNLYSSEGNGLSIDWNYQSQDNGIQNLSWAYKLDEDFYGTSTSATQVEGNDSVDGSVWLSGVSTGVEHSLHVALLDQETGDVLDTCLLYTSPSPRDATLSRMPSSA